MILRLLQLVLLLSTATALKAQLNVKIGYEMIFFKPEGTRAVIDAYNAQNTWLTDRFDDLKYMHGLHTGLRFQVKPLAWEASYSKRFRVQQAIGDDPVFGSETTRKLSYNVELISFLQEVQFGNFGVGASLDYNWLNIRTEIVDQVDPRSIVKDNAWSSQFHFVYHIPKTGFVSLSIQPYVQVYWDTFDVSALSREFNVDVGDNKEDDLSHFGIKFIFYNGE